MSTETNNIENNNLAEAPVESAATKKAKLVPGIGLSLIYFLIFLAVQVIFSAIISAAYSAYYVVSQQMNGITVNPEEVMEVMQSPEFLTPVLFICTLATAVTFALWYFIAHGRNKADKLKLNGWHIGSIAVAAVAMYTFALNMALITMAILPSQGEVFNDLMANALGGNAVLAFVTTVILAPVGEECLFRGLIFRTLQKYNFSVVAVIVIQALLFGLMHMNVVQSLYAIPIGILYGFVAYKTKSILPCIAMHMINNFMPNVFSLFPESIQTLVILIPVCIVLCAIAVCLYRMSKKVQA